MSEEFKYLEEITPWLEGRLHGEALAQFKQSRLNNPEFAQECKILLALQSGLARQRREDFRAQLAAIEAKVAQQSAIDIRLAAPQQPRLRVVALRRRLLAVAALLVPLILAGWWLLAGPHSSFSTGQTALQQLPVSVTRGMGETEAQRLFRLGEYGKAEPLYRRMLTDDEVSGEARYHLAVCLLHNSGSLWQRSKVREARSHLEMLRGETDLLPSRTIEVKAHLAVAYLMLGEPQQARPLLLELAALPPTDPYTGFARKLLDTI